MFYTYVLLCKRPQKAQEFYIGYCSDLKKRLAEHREGSVKSTKKFDKITLVYYEASANKTDARKREIQLKTGFGRGYLNRRLEYYLQEKRR